MKITDMPREEPKDNPLDLLAEAVADCLVKSKEEQGASDDDEEFGEDDSSDLYDALALLDDAKDVLEALANIKHTLVPREIHGEILRVLGDISQYLGMFDDIEEGDDR